MTSKL
jgi:hypothetical protein